MDIREIFDRVLLRSGQFVLRKSKIEVDIDSFRILVEDALAKLNTFSPKDKEYNLPMLGSRQYQFTATFDEAIGRAPDWLSTVRPMNSVSGPYNRNPRIGMQSELIIPIQAPWDFNIETKTLTVPFNDIYKIVAVYDHIIVETDDPASPGNKLYSVPTIDYNETEFFLLLQGLFLQSLGRSRRSFTLNDLPITMDADIIASEGAELVDKAIEIMGDTQKMRLAWGE